MKKSALLLLILAGSLTTFMTHRFAGTKNLQGQFESKKEAHTNIPSKLVSQQGFLDLEKASQEIVQEDPEISQIQKRLSEKYSKISKEPISEKIEVPKVKNKESISNSNMPKQIAKSDKKVEINVKKEKQNSEISKNEEKKVETSKFFEKKEITDGNDKKQKDNLSKQIPQELEFTSSKVLKEIYPETFAEKQSFFINNEKENFVIGKNGTLLVFPPNVFLNSQGTIENENIQIELQEYSQKSYLLFSNLITQNHDQIFDSEGIITFRAFKNGQELNLNPSKKVLVAFKSHNQDDNYYLFNQNETNQWQQIAEQDKNLIPIPLELLNMHNQFGNTYDRTIISTKEFAERYNYFSTKARGYQKALIGIYLSMMKEPLYKADEQAMLYLRDVKADKEIVETFEKFYQEKLGQVVDFTNIHLSSEISITDQYTKQDIDINEAERLAQYYLVRKATIEWHKTNPYSQNFAGKLFKVSKTGTYACMRVNQSKTNTASNVIKVKDFDSQNGFACLLSDKTNGIYKLGFDSTNRFWVNENDTDSHVIFIQRKDNINFVAIQKIDKNQFEMELELEPMTTMELESRINALN